MKLAADGADRRRPATRASSVGLDPRHRRRHQPPQPHAGGDRRGDVAGAHPVQRRADARSTTRTCRPRCSPTPTSPPSACRRRRRASATASSTSTRPRSARLKLTMTDKKERTFMKLVVDRASQRVVGAHMIGADAGEVIQGVAIAVKLGATKAQFDATIGIHPTGGGRVRDDAGKGFMRRALAAFLLVISLGRARRRGRAAASALAAIQPSQRGTDQPLPARGRRRRHAGSVPPRGGVRAQPVRPRFRHARPLARAGQHAAARSPRRPPATVDNIREAIWRPSPRAWTATTTSCSCSSPATAPRTTSSG